MPRRSILSAAERESLLALPETKDDLIRYYTFSDTDLSIIRQRRGPANRLGFAVQLCYLRFPGIILGVDQPPFPPLLKLIADQLRAPVESWSDYGQREQTRREHLPHRRFPKLRRIDPLRYPRFHLTFLHEALVLQPDFTSLLGSGSPVALFRALLMAASPSGSSPYISASKMRSAYRRSSGQRGKSCSSGTGRRPSVC